MHADAVVPRAQHSGDAGLDLVSIEKCVLAPGERVVVATGLSVAIPEGFAGFVLPRSGLATRYGVTVVNAPGLIDAGYRGEIKVALINLDVESSYTINAGDRVAQLVIVATPDIAFAEVAELSPSARGVGGFGSTGPQ